MKFNYRIFQFGDDCIVIEMGKDFNKETSILLNLLSHEITTNVLPQSCETVITLRSLTVYYDPSIVTELNPVSFFSRIVNEFLNKYEEKQLELKPVIHLPVCYNKKLAPDLEYVAQLNELSVEELIHIHSSETYFISYFDFGKNIPFIGGVNKKLSVPRKRDIRVNVPYGVVGIAGSQTGVYPINSTVGWQVIGRVPSSVLNQLLPSMEQGQDVRFTPITLEQFYEYEFGHLQSDIS